MGKQHTEDGSYRSIYLGEISGSYGGNEDNRLLESCAVYYGIGLPTFRRHLLPSSWDLMMETADKSEHGLLIYSSKYI
jgi:hypothetical protein